ncbi:MAG: HI0074 family nucleotidyltransferase substrate-binding subunit [Cyanobacteria bacterium]|nr:HI0074 family nucleotidyltransferase substrate-binding subunit [Cyanobacteriota bacterium]
MADSELRWRQRLESLQRALSQLKAALAALVAEPTNEVIGMAVIKGYELSFELGWKTLKDLLSHEGIDALLPREVLRQAFAYGLLLDGQLWIDMLEQRNLMAHTYDVERARLALTLIRERYGPALLALAADLEGRR